MAARRASFPYVPPLAGMARVLIQGELGKARYGSAVWFYGTFEDDPVKVEVLNGVQILRLRRALAEHGSVWFDLCAAYVEPWPEGMQENLASIVAEQLAELNVTARDQLTGS